MPVVEYTDHSSVAIEPVEDGDGQHEGRPDEELEDRRTEDEVQMPENAEESQIEVIPMAGTSSRPTVSVTEIYPFTQSSESNRKEKNSA
ncbi:hypothetical protein PR048_031497 [Dryococelus australis]|uniref:Uncharacterized protein n=1 Tax=Dryococelus australis TaxID=614101 RepID=A0ABQ9G5G4_9NEOP|nr:hypothetical protein PR048_031497 [Dryococelus australis]